MAVQSNDGSWVIHFGVFEADLRAGELRRNSSKVKLQEQPFQILAMLLERPGEIVTREELRARLWSADTFVDFDHGLNSAIRRLRDVLGDSAENPSFVETLGRRGYRFIAPVASRVLRERQQEPIESVAVLPFANRSADPNHRLLERRHHRKPHQQSVANLDPARHGAQHSLPLQRKRRRSSKGGERSARSRCGLGEIAEAG